MLEFLPTRLQAALQHLNRRLLYELRIRAGKPLLVNFDGKFVFLGEAGVCSADGALRPTEQEIEEMVFAASGYSVYAVEEQVRRGFLTANEGVRIGLAGSYVYEKGHVLSVRDVTSLCVRIPHEIRGCAAEIYNRCLGNGLCSLLILAPPGDGKTTILRDLCRLVSERTCRNLLVCDERGELSAGELGITADVVRFADKKTAFTAGIRAMRPDIIVTDELLPEDYGAVAVAIQGGVLVFASAHLRRYEDVPAKLFGRYVILDGLGKIGQVLDKDGQDVA